MIQNTIIKGFDNPVIIDFVFYDDMAEQGLLNFTEVKVVLGEEEYSSLDNNGSVSINSPTELVLDVGLLTNIQPSTLLSTKRTLTIIGINDNYPNGYVLQSPDIDLLKYPVIIE